MSPLRSSAGPAVCTKGTSSSEAMICASDVLPRPGGPASRTWSSASPRAAAASIETCSCSRRPSWPTNSSRVRGRSERSSSSSPSSAPRRVDALEGHRADPPQRAGQQLLGRLALGRGEQGLRLGRLEAELEQAVAGDVARVVAAGDGDRLVEVAGHADLLAQLDHDPLGRALADAGHGLQAGDVAGDQRGDQLARAAAAEHRERHLRPDRLHPDEREEEVALLLGGEAVEGQRVVANDQMRVQRDGAAHAGTWRSVSAETARR